MCINRMSSISSISCVARILTVYVVGVKTVEDMGIGLDIVEVLVNVIELEHHMLCKTDKSPVCDYYILL